MKPVWGTDFNCGPLGPCLLSPSENAYHSFLWWTPSSVLCCVFHLNSFDTITRTWLLSRVQSRSNDNGVLQPPTVVLWEGPRVGKCNWAIASEKLNLGPATKGNYVLLITVQGCGHELHTSGESLAKQRVSHTAPIFIAFSSPRWIPWQKHLKKERVYFGL